MSSPIWHIALVAASVGQGESGRQVNLTGSALPVFMLQLVARPPVVAV